MSVVGSKIDRAGSTLAEVLVGMLVLLLVMLAVLGVLIQSSHLERSDAEQTQVLALAQGLMEMRVDQARLLEGYDELESLPLQPTEDEKFLYRQEVSELPLGLKKLSISIYHADRNNPGSPDTKRVRDGHAITLSVSLAEPIR